MSAELWMKHRERTVEPPFFIVFRNIFEVKEATILRFTYSADERAQFYCDGIRIADGPPRGTVQRWFSAKVEVALPPGKHVLTARLLAFGKNLTAYGQMSITPGLFVHDDSGILSGLWECQVCHGCSFASAKTDWGSYAHLLTDETYNWDILNGNGGDWEEVARFEDSRNLVPALLPPMRYEEVSKYEQLENIFLFDDYVCVYGEYEFSGTGEVRLRWAEPGCSAAEFTPEFLKGSKPGDPFPYFSGPGDRFRLTGNKIRWNDYWWHAGRTLEMTFFGDVKLESVKFYQTGYPLKLNRSIEIPGDERLSRLLRRSWDTLAMCSFETLMDCPYYEQLQYISDSRIELLSIYELTEDTRLAENVLRQFAEGQYSSGALPCRYPTREAKEYTPVFGEYYKLHIPAFTAFYIQMVHDFARLHKNDALVRKLMPVLRRASDYLSGTIGEDGLLHVPGWNFIDWSEGWNAGIPTGCRFGEGCTLNLIYLLSLQNLAGLERIFGLYENAVQAEKHAAELAVSIRKAYYNPERKCYAENKERDYYSEHAQVFALLALNDTSVIRSLYEDELDECGIAFSFYYLEVCRIYRLDNLFSQRRERYLETADNQSLRTMPELFVNTWWMRSDCHAWGSHFLYHTFAKGSILDPISIEQPEMAVLR